MEWIDAPSEGLTLRDIRRITKRDQAESEDIRKAVEAILADIEQRGDAAVREYTKRFDGVDLDSFLVSPEEIDDAVDIVGPDFMAILEEAAANIRAYHERQVEQTWIDTFRPGVRLGAKFTPIQRVGVYVPGGTAAYPSTVLMDTIPAHVAGVPSIAVFTPPAKDGSVNPYILAAAHVAGATEIYKVGGAQGIAAAAYGTESIPPVFKIVGPGNAYVAMAKRLVFGTVGIDMIAGPSEVGVLADHDANPVWVAADLLAQAEHDRRAAVFLVTPSAAFAREVEAEVRRQLEELPRKDIAAESIEKHAKFFIVKDKDQAVDIMNLIAPEHLEIAFSDAETWAKKIVNAGAIFMGPYTTEPLGDYFAGPNHTLPTMGTAAFSSPLGVYDFVKRSSLLEYDKDAFTAVADKVMRFANVEGLQAHGLAVRRRIDE
ncbi:MAG: histidinol dehydrogenase [Limosilactobacillus oris]|uniref:histidinol dehydrogenase n=1 Tax=unclassified Megasphaera TaxID=2626256 RepID=UPI0003570A28|nr:MULTISPECIES: histidinol dehydrogenase [unclassified Megasphaera]MCH3902237.1 histidinol dehydrogenase [Limosilactobacillus oris]MCI1906085.1 histidinol dehydrogenase [Enterococcaceae bacterium]EPP15456.1 histidinol dehydrogenase [Megasphaera sp. BL7]EPP18723.1 histidinol dehydrogenase [Megasphaera sp. NM10]MBS7221878.1 histidinol dehydrogenase [Megasphaera sp.]